MSKITEKIWELAEPIAEENGCEIWDVEYVKEASNYFLRIYIDKEGGVGIEDCEKISRAMDPILDENDIIPDSYTFEVGSPGIERELKRESDFLKYIGSEVEVKTYKAVDNSKTLIGELKEFADGDIVIVIENNDVKIEKANIAKVSIHVSF